MALTSFNKNRKKNKQIENKFTKLLLARLRVELNEPAFMKFLWANIETLPHRLSDELLKRTTIKSMKSTELVTSQVFTQCFSTSFCFVLLYSFNFSVCCHHYTYAQMKRNIANTEFVYYFFVILKPAVDYFSSRRGSSNLRDILFQVVFFLL